MNKLVKVWNDYQVKPKYDGPDTIEVDGQKMEIGEIKDGRKKDKGSRTAHGKSDSKET